MAYLSNEDFANIYSKVPRLNVDLAIRSSEGILLALRTIDPHKGKWHVPGGTVYKGETIVDAATRVAKKETGLDIVPGKCLGYMEFPKENRSGLMVHTISIMIEASPKGGVLKHDENADDLRYFKSLPENMIPEQYQFLLGFQ